jgi:Staphylococcal nuclease homologue
MTGSATQVFIAFGLAIALAARPCAGWAQIVSPSQASGCVGEARPDRLQGLTSEGDLVLASGGLARLAGIRLPEAPPQRDLALAWLRARTDQAILAQGPSSRDRWDRLSVRVRMADASHPLDLGHGLVESGLAMVDPGLDEAFCQPELLALEETARERRLGLWAEDRYKPIDVNQLDRLQDRVGSFVLIDGLVRSIGERKQRTYLNFGGLWAEDFTIIIPRKTWKLMADRGLNAVALKGRRIRARGILQSWQGTALSLVMPEMIERLDDGRLPR